MLSQSALSQTLEPIQEAPIVEEESESPNGFKCSFSKNISSSKLRDSPHSVISSAILVMMTNMTSLEEQVTTIAQTLEREALIDTQITFIMDKMGNASGSNCENESFKPKQTHHDEPESSAKSEKNSKNLKISTDGSIFSEQLKELIKEVIKDLVGGVSQHPLPMPNHTLKG